MLSPIGSTRSIARAISGALVWAAAVPVWAQLTIYHVPPDCYPREGHLIVRASIVPDEPDVTVRLYFGSEDDASGYFVDMKPQEGNYVAALPTPLPATRQVSYFIESWDPKYEIVRSKTYRLKVSNGEASCALDPSLVASGEGQEIIVHSTSKGAAPQPPGFAPDGVAAFEQGEALGPKKNNSKKIAAGVLATGLSAGTVAVLKSGSGGQTSSGEQNGGTPPPPTTTTTTPTTPPPSGPPPAPVIACFDAPATALVGQQIRLDASCAQPRSELSYDWDLGDGREREGRVISPAYRSAGEYTISLTVKRGTSDALVDRDQLTRRIEILEPTQSIPTPSSGGPPGTADLAIGMSGILTPRIIVYGITYVMTVVNFGPAPATGITLVDELPPTLILNGVSGAFCTRTGNVTCDLGTLPPGSTKTVTMDVTVSWSVPVGEVVVNTATVSAAERDPRPASNRAESRVQIAISQKAGDAGSAFDTSLTTSLEGFPQVVQGSVLFNGSTGSTLNSTAPARLPFRGAPGRVAIEAYLSAPARGDGTWQFDFTRTEHFQPGSIEVRRGRVLHQDGSRVVFQIGAAADERIEFTVKLTP
jgi:hypothetical protein